MSQLDVVAAEPGDMQPALVISPTPSAADLERVPLAELSAAAVQLFDNDRYQDAAALYAYVLAKRCRRLPVWIGLARCHEALGQHTVALRVFEAALRALTHVGAARSELDALAALIAHSRRCALRGEAAAS